MKTITREKFSMTCAVRFSPQLHNKLQVMAVNQGKSMSTVVREIVIENLDRLRRERELEEAAHKGALLSLEQRQTKPLSCTGMDGQPVRPGIHVLAQVSPTLKKTVRLAAEDAGVSVSEWLRRLIVKELGCG